MAYGRILIDDNYKWLIKKYKFNVAEYKNRKKFYAYVKINGKNIGLHRIIIALEEKDPLFLVDTKKYVDHINGNGLDNRCLNLRKASSSLNQINKVIQKNNTSGYNGVNFNKSTGKYILRFNDGEKRRYGGMFSCKHDAAEKYNEIVSEIWGSNVILNVIKREV